MSINNIIHQRGLIATAIMCTAFLVSSCKQDPVDPTSQRLKLGDIRAEIISSLGNRTALEFRARVTNYDKRDTTIVLAGGTYKHFIALRDTLTRDSLKVYYTLPTSARIKVDTSLRVVLIYKQIASRFALILKTKSDSLICMIGTLLQENLDSVQVKAGEQGFRVSVGTNLYASRNTECGREGDFNMMFSTHSGIVEVPPARADQIVSADKLYALYNVANTQLIKDLELCPDFSTEFSYMIIKQ